MIECDEEIRRLSASSNLQARKMKMVHDGVVRRLKTVSTLEELTKARLVDLAQKELSRIVSASEVEANRRIDNGQASEKSRAKYSHCCPYCNKAIGYSGKKAGKTVQCPYKKCGRSITLPPVSSVTPDQKL